MISTRLRIALFFTLLGILILGIFSTSVIFEFHREWVQDEQEELHDTIISFQQKVLEKIHQNDDEKEENFAEESEEFFGSLQKIKGEIVTENGEKIFSSPDFPLAQEMVKGVFFLPAQQKNMVLTQRISEHHLIITVAESSEDYITQEHNFIRISLFSIVISAIFLFLIGYLFAWKILSPLRKISGEIQKISLSDLSKRLPLQGYKNDEIRVLSGNFNDMIERLELSTANLKQFIHNAAHELKTPLSIMDTDLQLAIKTKNLDKIEDAQQEIKKFSTTINTLLILAESEKIVFSNAEKEKFFLKTEIEEIEKKITPHFYEKKISLTKNIADSIFWTVEKTSFRQVLWNILWNAYKFSPENSEIHIFADAEKISISNRGTLSSEEQKKIFLPFYRSETSKSAEGSGLGLTISQKLAEANGKAISVFSKNGEVVFEVKES